MSAQWEAITETMSNRLDRIRVAGGYLYRTIVFGPSGQMAVGLTFVPDLPRGPDGRAR